MKLAALSLLALTLLAPLAAEAQQVGKIPRIGMLGFGDLKAPAGIELLGAFWQGMRDHGWVEGQNIAMEYRVAEGRAERFPDLAAELVRLQVDVLFTTS